MRSRPGGWSQNPVILLCLVAALSAFVVQSGELGTSDTAHRLQTTHSFWTSEPEVFPYEYPEFGLHGRGGRLHSWYGMGQSLLMLPADIVGTYISRLPIFDEYDDTDPTVRSIFVSFTTNILISVLTVLIVLRLLRQFGFTVRESIAGVLALLFCTTHLHYTQNMMENNYIMLLTLAGFSYQYEWLCSGKGRALFWGSAALGLNLLTRLTTAIDIAAASMFLLLVLCFRKELHRWRALFRDYFKIAVPVVGIFFLIDRIYQYVRFGSFFNTYVTVFGQEFRQRDPSLPATFPWNNPLHTGLLSPFVMPEKSIFIFDPLIVLTLVVTVLGWSKFGAEVRGYLLSVLFLILGDVVLYAKYFAWAGDMAWGDRYVSTAVELAAFISVPLLLRYRAEFGRFVWTAGLGLVGVSLVIQLASLAFWLPLEIYQMETLGHPTFVVLLRLRNVVAFALGKMDAWGLNTPTLTQDPWDYVHITTWNFLPFLLRRVGEAPAWVVRVTFAIWGTALAALAWTLVRLRAVVKTEPLTYEA